MTFWVGFEKQAISSKTYYEALRNVYARKGLPEVFKRYRKGVVGRLQAYTDAGLKNTQTGEKLLAKRKDAFKQLMTNVRATGKSPKPSRVPRPSPSQYTISA